MFNTTQLQVIEGLLKEKNDLTEVENGLLIQIQEILNQKDEYLDEILKYFKNYNIVTITKELYTPVRNIYIESDTMTKKELDDLIESFTVDIMKNVNFLGFKLEGKILRSNEEINITSLETILY